MKVSILIPVYNEENTIAVILKKVSEAKLPPKFSKEILVINDGSTDETLKILKTLKLKFRLISHTHNSGKGMAVRTGIAKSNGDIILIQDADTEYNPQDFERLLKPFMNSKVQAVYGSRFHDYPLILRGENKTPLPLHWIANKTLTFLVRILYGSLITDMETCYKVIRREVLVSLNLVSRKFDLEPEITAKLLKRKINIVEIPIKVKPRDYSQGKKIGWWDGVVATWVILKHRLIQ